MKNEKAIHTLEGITRDIRAMDVRVDNLAPIGPRIGALLSRAVGRQFTTKGAYFGTPWKPLKPSTIADKIRKGFSAPNPLVRTGQLKLSFVGRPMAVEKYAAKKLTYGSSLRKAIWQQKGTYRKGRRHIPPRVMFRVTRVQAEQIAEAIADWVAKGKLR